jgi:hypothetical protein
VPPTRPESEHRLRARLVTCFDNAATAWRLEWAVELCESKDEGARVLKRWAVETTHDLLGGCAVSAVRSHYWSEQVQGYKQVLLAKGSPAARLAGNMACKSYQILFKGLGAHLKEKK